MLHLKKSLVAALGAGVVVVGMAAPADAIVQASRGDCTNPVTLSYWKIDNPAKSGLQQIGTARLRAASECYYGGENFGGYWSEGYLDTGGSIQMKIQFHMKSGATYMLSKWGSGKDWNPSPVLGEEITDYVDHVSPHVGGHTLYQ